MFDEKKGGRKEKRKEENRNQAGGSNKVSESLFNLEIPANSCGYSEQDPVFRSLSRAKVGFCSNQPGWSIFSVRELHRHRN